jgi:glutamate dehydrogenase
MSGDVFGNGMLLSKQIKLLAAFDHRHIFLDPDPDPAKSWTERERMFGLPSSSWDDYDRKLISRGGGVYPRTLKSIPITPQIRSLLGITADSLAPVELIHAILKAPAELLYLGGIGTYVKARNEANIDVGDKANDGVRINGSELRVKVVGEGANLGLTQAGRIEFAQTGAAGAGGRIDTDAIDNSAGVDTSDHEVNIKILTGMLERTGELTRKRRDTLLQSMTADVAQHVLANNYDQTLALSLMEMDSAGELMPHAQFMAELEAKGRLDREVEGLPDALEIAERAQSGKGLTRPELAVLLAYGKLELKREIVESDAADDPYFERLLVEYFPKLLRRYEGPMRRHRLRREIIATVVANDIINRCGPSFASRLMPAAGADALAFTAGYEAAKAVLEIPALWDAVAGLDGKAPAAGQMALFRRMSAALRGATFWLTRRAAREKLEVDALVSRYGPAFKVLRKLLPGVLSPIEQAAVQARVRHLVEAGAPEDKARAVAILQPLTTSADLADIAEASSWPLANVARLYHAIGENFGFDRVREAASTYSVGDSFERTALRRLIEDLLTQQSEITRTIMAFTGGAQCGDDSEAAHDAARSWAALHREKASAARRTITDIEASSGPWTFAKLTIANAALRELAAEGVKRRTRG